MMLARLARVTILAVGIAIPMGLSSGPAAATDCATQGIAPCWSDTVGVVGHAAVNIPNPTVPPTPSDNPFTVTSTPCTIASDPGESIDPNPACDFSASGTVHDTVCGTGTVDATFTIHEGVAPNQDTYSGTINGIQFVAGQAVPFRNAPVTESDSTSATMTGTVDAVPDAPIPGDGFCTHGFTFVVTGTITESGD